MPKKIMVVDDDIEILTTLQKALEKSGYHVKTVEAGKEAVEIFIASCYGEDDPFDLILLDVGLPDISGLEVLQLIRQEEQLRGLKYENGVRIIIQTGIQKSWMESFNRGCDDFMVKPYTYEDLIEKIRKKIGED